VTDLILVPTPTEMTLLSPRLRAGGKMTGWAFQLCGFGPIASAARAAALISRYRPSRVLLVGIAGSFDVDEHPIGSACRFDQVACDGVGVGTGQDFRGGQSLGWDQFSGGDAHPRVTDVIPLVSTFIAEVPCQGTLLTCCAASANDQHANQRRGRYPDAVAEDMEGFGVAMACTLAGVPLQIVRGISNRVGDRDPTNWRVEDALDAASDLAMKILPWRWIPTET
jgi:futalosine hydrolase